ncbi:MAG TPA: hypothetical protein VHD36_07955 [Pirellulales bacterium]|nr:hypothetical protein [Pirellulales bacterium]
MSEPENDPLEEAHLAEAWNAFAQLARTAEAPFDEAAFAARLTTRLARQAERDQRRRRLWIGTSALATAASLLVIVALYSFVSRQQNNMPQALPDQAAPRVAVAPAPDAPADPVDARAPAVDDTPAHVVSIAPWDDELAVETASLADELQSVERQWGERPDSIALLQSQIDQFEQEMKSGEL